MPMVVLAFTALAIATEVRRLRRSTTRARRASPRPSTPSSRRPTTTARPSRATRASCSRTHPATSAPTGSASPTSIGGLALFAGRFPVMIAVLALAGSLAGKRVTPAGPGTFRTDTPTFVVLLLGVVIIVGALTFFPALLLGPIVQGLSTELVLTMRRDLIASRSRWSSSRVLFGLAYPLAMTGASQLLFPDAVRRQPGRARRRGRRLASDRPGLQQAGTEHREGGRHRLVPDERYFQSRPSATGYSADVTYFNNLGPNNADLAEFFDNHAAAYVALEGPYNPGLTTADVPVDAVTTSASGVDPAHLRGERADPGASRRRGPWHRARARRGADRRAHRRASARVPRRARGERARAQHRDRRGGLMTDRPQASVFNARRSSPQSSAASSSSTRAR